jgi:hypothetical protein
MQASSSRVGFWTAASAIAGVALASWLAPKGIAWYFDPPVDIGVNCRAATEWSMQRLLIFQGSGLGVGAAVGLTLSLLKKKAGPQDT